MNGSGEEREKIFSQMLDYTNQFVILIEPGTPDSFRKLQTLRKIAKEKDFFVISPCTHQEECKLSKEDWCHSVCRVQRSKIHRMLKQGDLPYEDEKFSYYIFAKKSYPNVEKRILRHPVIEKNRVILKICTKDEIKEISITKKEKEQYKLVKKKHCGDSI